MSDFDTITAILDRAKIGWARREHAHSESYSDKPLPEGSFSIIIGEDRDADPPPGPYGNGYIGFYSELSFSADGALIAVRAWE